METVDLTSAPANDPLGYPGSAVIEPSVLVGDRLMRLANADLDNVLSSLSAAPMTSRTPCVAIGSNACAAQLAAKLVAAKPSGRVLPIVPTLIAGLRRGFGAFVNRRGYIPFAPVADPTAVSRLHILWLDEEQVRLLDATEPNYHRLVGPYGAQDAVLYRSRHGVLRALGAHTPLEVSDQRSLFTWLCGQRWFADVLGIDAPTVDAPGIDAPGIDAARGTDARRTDTPATEACDATTAIALLAADERRRAAVREQLAENGLVCEDGLAQYRNTRTWR
jgi:hypothetical protein